MGTMNRLLHKPLKAFALYALILLLGSIPVYVLVMDHIWNNELDENNKLRLEFIKSQLDKGHFNETELNKVIENWSILRDGPQIGLGFMGRRYPTRSGAVRQR